MFAIDSMHRELNVEVRSLRALDECLRVRVGVDHFPVFRVYASFIGGTNPFYWLQ
jgi:hypothetical protein